MQYDLLGYVDFLYLLRRLWTSAPCDRSVAVSQMSLDLQILRKSAYHLSRSYMHLWSVSRNGLRIMYQDIRIQR